MALRRRMPVGVPGVEQVGGLGAAPILRQQLGRQAGVEEGETPPFEGQEIADTDRSAVEDALEALPGPLGLSKTTAAIMSLESYPFSSGPVGSVDKVRLQRVVDVMQQFIGFPAFNIDSMLIGG